MINRQTTICFFKARDFEPVWTDTFPRTNGTVALVETAFIKGETRTAVDGREVHVISRRGHMDPVKARDLAVAKGAIDAEITVTFHANDHKCRSYEGEIYRQRARRRETNQGDRLTPFALLESLAGLSHREAGEFHRVRIDTIKSWAVGRNPCPPGAIAELRALVAAQERAAREALAIIASGKPDEIELGYPADDAEARALGWPCVGAWAAMAARVLAATEARAILVPRGSTVATAAAADAHGR